MNESMYKYMKVGLIHFVTFPEAIKGEGPILETIKKIAVDDYFNAIEVSWIRDEEIREKAKKMLEASHMTIAYGAQPRLLTTGLNLNDLKEEERLKAVASLKEGIDEAEYMGAKTVALLSGEYEEATKEESYQALVKSTKELCQYANGKDMNVALELFDYDIEKKSLISSVDIALRFAKEIRKGYSNFGLIVNLSHLPSARKSAEKSLMPIKDYIVHAHMGNAVCKDTSMPAYGDKHPRFGFPNSENDVPELVEYLRVLKDIGFLNKKSPPIVSFEVRPFGDEDPEIVIANAKRTLNEAWARVPVEDSKTMDRRLWLY